MTSSLVGSEMCIRDSALAMAMAFAPEEPLTTHHHRVDAEALRALETVSYTHLTLPTICSV
eukprot:11208636-Prorocentrum_lima.AAC.1